MKQQEGRKVIIYQVLPRLFGNKNTTNRRWGSIQENGCGKMNDFSTSVLRHIKDMGVTHIWYTGVIRHATVTDYSSFGIPRQHPEVVKGKAGSPYAITDYYDIDPDLADDVDHRMEEFEALIARTHEAGLKVIMDFVPNHVAREYKSICKPARVKDLGENDHKENHFDIRNNFYYCWGQPLVLPHVAGQQQVYTEIPAKATGNDRFTNTPDRNDWYETVKLNYGIDYCDAGGRSEHFLPIPDTWNKMTDILLFWASKGIDAFRCDMAEMVPPAFWTWAIDKVNFRYPHIRFIGEVYNPQQYRTYLSAGFDWLYDKVGMYDSVKDIIRGQRWASDITWQWQQTDDIGEHMLYFLENHDEQRIASDFFAADARKGIPGMMVMAWLQRNPVMLYAGQEYGEQGMDEEGFSGHDGRTTIFDYWCVKTILHGYFQRRKMSLAERSMENSYLQILKIASEERAIREGAFFDLMYAQSDAFDRVHLFTFLRKAEEETLLVVVNFSDEERQAMIRIPRHAVDFLQMKTGAVRAVDLLDKSEQLLVISPDADVHVTVPAWCGIVLKF
ncbi:MAG: alpha-amylase [Prevotella sp.]|nr:alpha-amylase [Prevotella sp.]